MIWSQQANMKKLPPSSCKLVDGEYEIQLFRGNQTIISATFPSLHLTAEQVLKVEQKIGYVTLVLESCTLVREKSSLP